MATTYEVRFQQWIRAVAQNTSRCTSRRYRNKAGRLPGRSDFVQRERPRQRASVAGMGIEGPSSSLARHAFAPPSKVGKARQVREAVITSQRRFEIVQAPPRLSHESSLAQIV